METFMYSAVTGLISYLLLLQIHRITPANEWEEADITTDHVVNSRQRAAMSTENLLTKREHYDNCLFKKNLIAAAVTLASTQTFAAAFQLNEHSASGLGAYAGEAFSRHRRQRSRAVPQPGGHDHLRQDGTVCIRHLYPSPTWMWGTTAALPSWPSSESDIAPMPSCRPSASLIQP